MPLQYIDSSTTGVTDLSSSNEIKLKLKSDSSDFPVSTGTDSEFKSFGSTQKTGRETSIIGTYSYQLYSFKFQYGVS